MMMNMKMQRKKKKSELDAWLEIVSEGEAKGNVENVAK